MANPPRTSSIKTTSLVQATNGVKCDAESPHRTKVIHVSKARSLNECIVSIGFAKSRSNMERALPYFTWFAHRVMKIRMMGSAALALTYVANGRLDAYIERGISLWDIAAGALILECAGGKFWCEATAGNHKFRMIASNGLVHKKLPPPK